MRVNPNRARAFPFLTVTPGFSALLLALIPVYLVASFALPPESTGKGGAALV